ncbi:MAG: glycosyltransferase family 2 protein [Muribaculaceae bacterium]|nr:glycosyltransferase family 2 protein [Muribaculaceae bacterium]
MMKEKPSAYDWASYYRAAYEKEKKKNIVLAGKLADMEAKETDLALRLERIRGNIFWKLSAPARKCYYALTGKKRVKPDIEADKKAVQAIRDYQQEVFAQRHPYLQWIEAEEGMNARALEENKNNERNAPDGSLKENSCSLKENSRSEIEINGWHRIDWTDADLTVILCGNGVFDAQMAENVKSWFNKNENCLFAYGDEDYYWQDLSNRMCPWYKPDWSPDTLLSFCYIGHVLIAKQSLCNELIEQARYQKGTYQDFYDLCLRLEELAARLQRRVGHMEEVLFHNRYEPEKLLEQPGTRASGAGEKEGQPDSGTLAAVREGQPDTDILAAVEAQLSQALDKGYDFTGSGSAFCAVREAALERRGIRAHLETGADSDIYHVVYEVEGENGGFGAANNNCDSSVSVGKAGLVSVIIPSKDHPDILEECLSSFREKTDYDNYEWIVVDNGSNLENKKRMELLQQEYGFCYLYEPMEFNFSAMCNLGASRAKGEYLLLLNDDIEIFQKDWLRILVGQAAQPHVGAVGAKLWYAGTEIIQHAGITNLEIGPSHKLASLADDRNYYYGRNLVAYDMIGVTAACLLVKADKYREVGGMDETMKIAYNDVDFCFQLIEAGYYNVQRNDAVLYHHESLSRGLDEEDTGKWSRLLQEKERLYAKHPAMKGADRFYHKNLLDDGLKYTCNFKADCNRSDKTLDIMPGNPSSLAGAIQGMLQLTIDSAGAQHKIHEEDTELAAITGWAYLPGMDNAVYERSILLQSEDGTFYTAHPFPWLRTDVEDILTNEVNISLSGFVVRFPKEKLPSGVWKIGMLAEHVVSHRKFLGWSDVWMRIEG